jgi:phosphohistidine phosphatase
VRLILLRHAVAVEREEWPAEKEFERPLTPGGKKKLRKIVHAFSEHHEPPARIYSSPLERCRQTADIAGRALKAEVILVPELSPDGDAWNWLHLLREENLMVVGHEPDLSLLATQCLGLQYPVFSFKKAGMAALGGPPGQMQLEWLLTPRWLLD